MDVKTLYLLCDLCGLCVPFPCVYIFSPTAPPTIVPARAAAGCGCVARV